MKGCLSYEIVRKISEGMKVQEACDLTVYDFVEDLSARDKFKDDFQISVVAMDNQGN